MVQNWSRVSPAVSVAAIVLTGAPARSAFAEFLRTEKQAAWFYAVSGAFLIRFNKMVFKRLFEIARISNFTEREIKQYEAAMMNRYDQNACIAYAKKEGEARGEKRGIGIGMKRAAKNMLKEGFKPALVARITQLPKEQIMALKRA